jgi:hypothetical protein
MAFLVPFIAPALASLGSYALDKVLGGEMMNNDVDTQGGVQINPEELNASKEVGKIPHDETKPLIVPKAFEPNDIFIDASAGGLEWRDQHIKLQLQDNSVSQIVLSTVSTINPTHMNTLILYFDVLLTQSAIDSSSSYRGVGEQYLVGAQLWPLQFFDRIVVNIDDRPVIITNPGTLISTVLASREYVSKNFLGTSSLQASIKSHNQFSQPVSAHNFLQPFSVAGELARTRTIHFEMELELPFFQQMAVLFPNSRLTVTFTKSSLPVYLMGCPYVGTPATTIYQSLVAGLSQDNNNCRVFYTATLTSLAASMYPVYCDPKITTAMMAPYAINAVPFEQQFIYPSVIRNVFPLKSDLANMYGSSTFTVQINTSGIFSNFYAIVPYINMTTTNTAGQVIATSRIPLCVPGFVTFDTVTINGVDYYDYSSSVPPGFLNYGVPVEAFNCYMNQLEYRLRHSRGESLSWEKLFQGQLEKWLHKTCTVPARASPQSAVTASAPPPVFLTEARVMNMQLHENGAFEKLLNCGIQVINTRVVADPSQVQTPAKGNLTVTFRMMNNFLGLLNISGNGWKPILGANNNGFLAADGNLTLDLVSLDTYVMRYGAQHALSISNIYDVVAGSQNA